jgi:hypothetical protein
MLQTLLYEVSRAAWEESSHKSHTRGAIDGSRKCKQGSVSRRLP